MIKKNSVAIFSAKEFEKSYLLKAAQASNISPHLQLEFFDNSLNIQTAPLAKGFDIISCFVTDQLSAETLKQLSNNGTKLIALRCAGFNHVDVAAAKSLGITIARVPAYSPYAVAEFAVGLILTLNRKIHKAYQLAKEHNFLLTHLLGFDLHGKTVGIIGTGKIGSVFAKIMHGFGCQLLASDPNPNPACTALGVQYVSLNQLFQQSDMISCHCPLNTETFHLINSTNIPLMKKGVMIINTGRGALIDSKAIVQGLKSGQIGYLGLDVYEEEENIFFQDLSEKIIQDDVFARLQSFPNVIITGHQAFFTAEALHNIAKTTMQNICAYLNHSSDIFIV